MMPTPLSNVNWRKIRRQAMSSGIPAAYARSVSPAVAIGKRGGFRVIYYHFAADARIALLLIYPKSEKDDLSVEDRKALKAMIEKWR